MRIVVVEDEVLVRRGIVSGIPWAEHGIEVAGDAADGRTGLELVRQLKPDMVITDIRMPIMDGLEMIRHIRRELPDTIILILSVREDFSAVQEALRLGVIDYVHKLTMSPEELLESVLQANRSRSGSRSAAAPSAAPDSDSNAGSRLTDWLAGQTESYRELPGAGEGNVRYVVGVVRFPPDADPGLARELLQSADHNDLRQAVMEKGEREAVFYAEMPVSAAPNREAAASEVKAALTAALQAWGERGRSVSVGISSVFEDRQDRIRAYREAADALQRRFYSGPGRVHAFRPPAPTEGTESPETFASGPFLKAYLTALEQPDDAYARQIFDELFPSQAPKGASPTFIRDRIVQWQSAVLMLIGEWKLPIQGIWQDDSPFDRVNRLETYPELREWCLRLHTLTRELWDDVSFGGRRSDIELAIRYIKENYNRPLRLPDIAAKVNLSENYFSHLFSKNTGKSFVYYLQELRVHKAKEFLREGSQPWFEIGEKVGFDNPKYFSKIFKRHTRLTPAQFQRSK
ncbi:response regulator [Cohnella panacarvi]|uniref:response regulator n=1 Tax=Cohnella panacarvi TaxID=400776 RepID=UPI00047DF709|nr:response regulator [Cohnella panacarvi]